MYKYKKMSFILILVLIVSTMVIYITIENNCDRKSNQLMSEFYLEQSFDSIEMKYNNISLRGSTIELDKYKHLNHLGYLRLEFDEKKLYKATFYPYDTMSYIKTLNKNFCKDIRYNNIQINQIGIYAAYTYPTIPNEILNMKKLSINWYHLDPWYSLTSSYTEKLRTIEQSIGSDYYTPPTYKCCKAH